MEQCKVNFPSAPAPWLFCPRARGARRAPACAGRAGLARAVLSFPGSVSVLCCSVLAAVLALLGCCLSLRGAQGQRGELQVSPARPLRGGTAGAALPPFPGSPAPSPVLLQLFIQRDERMW